VDESAVAVTTAFTGRPEGCSRENVSSIGVREGVLASKQTACGGAT
jgi:hypothetical protein